MLDDVAPASEKVERSKLGETFHRCPSSEMTVTVFLLYLVMTPLIKQHASV